MATLYKADGTQETVAPKNGADFQLGELYAMLECDTIEVISLRDKDRSIMIMDEDGKMRQDWVLNQRATTLAMQNWAIFDGDVIAGHALVCKDSELQ
jgi:hypothetical protein